MSVIRPVVSPVVRSVVSKVTDNVSAGEVFTPITDGLVAAYLLTEASGARAASVGGLNLAQQGTVGSASGINGLAASFDGTSKHLWAANNSILQFGDTDWTVSFWVKPTSTSGYGVIFAKGNRFASTELIVYQNNTTYGVQLYNGVNTVLGTINFASTLTTNWAFVSVIHRATEKSLTLVVNDQASATVYSGTTAAGTGVFAIGSNPSNGTSPSDPFNGLVGYLDKHSRALSVSDLLAKYNNGTGQFYPYTSFQRISVTAPRVMFGRGIGETLDANKSTNTQATTQTRSSLHSPYHPATKVKCLWANAYSNYESMQPTGENSPLGTGNNITIRAAMYADGRGTPVQLTFGGQLTATLAPLATVESDEIDVGLFRNQPVRIRTEVVVASGSHSWPANSQSSSADAWTVLGTSDVLLNAATYAPGFDGQFHFGPCAVMGRVPTAYAASNQKYDCVIRGDSISPYLETAMSTGRVPYLMLGRSGEAITDLTRTNADATRTVITRKAQVLIDEYGVNDIRAARTSAQLIADKTAMWTTWCTSSNIVRIVATSITPLPGFSTTERNTYNSWLAGLNSASVSALVGKTVNYQFVDVASCMETSPGSNTWVAGQTTDSVHPNTTGYATIQSTFGAALVTAVSTPI